MKGSWEQLCLTRFTVDAILLVRQLVPLQTEVMMPLRYNPTGTAAQAGYSTVN